MRWIVLLLVVMLAALGGWIGSSSTDDPTALVGLVVSVPDGDTINVQLATGVRPVRVIGVDTPEIAHDGRPAACAGDLAGRFTRAALLHERVELIPGVERTDRYGRLLAAVRPLGGSLRGADLAETLAARGLARQLAIPPNDGNATRIAALVADARRSNLGLWGACTFTSAFPQVR